MMIDTHTHLYLNAFDEDREEVVNRAKSAGVEKLLLPNIDQSTAGELLKLCDQFPGICYPMMGLHPGSVFKNYTEVLKHIESNLKTGTFIAIGEIGIDLYWDKTFQKEQEIVLETQLSWARDYKLPVVLHSRDSFQEIFQILDKVYTPGMSGVFHSFTGGREEIEKILTYDFYIGINGIVSFKNSQLRNILKYIPENRLLLETDSPYLAPVPKRGKRNESSYLPYINDFIANQLDKDPAIVAEITTRNAKQLFKI